MLLIHVAFGWICSLVLGKAHLCQKCRGWRADIIMVSAANQMRFHTSLTMISEVVLLSLIPSIRSPLHHQPGKDPP